VNVVISPDQAAVAGDQIVGQVDASIQSFDLSTFTSGGLPLKASRLSLAAAGLPHLVPTWLPRLVDADSCGTISSVVDTDGDGVPDDATITFDAATCTSTSGDTVVTLTGSIRIADPGTVHGFDITFTNLELRATTTPSTTVLLLIRINGSESIRLTSTSAQLTKNYTVVFQGLTQAGAVSGSIGDTWSVAFAAGPGLVIDPQTGLPDGTFNSSGTTRWSFQAPTESASASFGVLTQTALAYDADCTTEPRIVSGELRARVEGNQGGAYIRIQYQGCGLEPIITLVPTAS
jgi:hypothetical protein